MDCLEEGRGGRREREGVCFGFELLGTGVISSRSSFEWNGEEEV